MIVGPKHSTPLGAGENRADLPEKKQANASLITATLRVAAVSSSVVGRPRTILAPTVSKIQCQIQLQDIDTWVSGHAELSLASLLPPQVPQPLAIAVPFLPATPH